MCKLNVNFDKIKGRIKPVHAVGQPPWHGLGGQYLHYLTEAHIPYARLHDMGGAYGGFVYVDIPNIFRDFSADETDPKSYDFTFTDILTFGFPIALVANDVLQILVGIDVFTTYNFGCIGDDFFR